MSKHSATGAVWKATRLRILNRDGWQCQHCGKPLEDNADATVDHVQARSKGGTDTDDNLVSLCRVCNSKKGDRTLIRWPYWNTKWLDSLN